MSYIEYFHEQTRTVWSSDHEIREEEFILFQNYTQEELVKLGFEFCRVATMIEEIVEPNEEYTSDKSSEYTV